MEKFYPLPPPSHSLPSSSLPFPCSPEWPLVVLGGRVPRKKGARQVMELGLHYQPHLWPTVSPNGEGFFSQLLNGVRLRKKRGNLDQIPSLSLSCCPSQPASPPFPGPSPGSILNASMGSRALWPQMPLSRGEAWLERGWRKKTKVRASFLARRPP